MKTITILTSARAKSLALFRPISEMAEDHDQKSKRHKLKENTQEGRDAGGTQIKVAPQPHPAAPRDHSEGGATASANMNVPPGGAQAGPSPIPRAANAEAIRSASAGETTTPLIPQRRGTCRPSTERGARPQTPFKSALLNTKHSLKLAAALSCFLLFALTGYSQKWVTFLPFDASNPFIWDNDTNSDTFDQEVVMALANNNQINLIGITQSPQPYRGTAENLQEIVVMARAIGWKYIPNSAWDLGIYYKTSLTHPSNDVIESTVPLVSESSTFIRDQVLNVGTAQKPVVIGTGGSMTTVASAYLLANQVGRGAEFASKVIVIAGIGNGDSPNVSQYNSYLDQWAAYITIQRLTTVVAAGVKSAEPNVWDYIANTLPDNQLTQYMRSKQAYGFYAYWDQRYPLPSDCHVVWMLLYPTKGTYFNAITPISFNGWTPMAIGPFQNTNAYNQQINIKTDLIQNTKVFYVSSFVNSTLTNGSPLATSSYMNAMNRALASTGLSRFDSWRSNYFGSSYAIPPTFAAGGNPAGDGVPNLMKYALGMNPIMNSRNGLPVDGSTIVSGTAYRTLTYTRNKAATDITYHLEWSTDFVSWSSTGLSEQVLSDNGVIERVQGIVPLNSGQKIFTRVRVTLP